MADTPTPSRMSSTDMGLDKFWVHKIIELLTGNKPGNSDRFGAADIDLIATRIGREHREQVVALRQLRQQVREDEALAIAARNLIRAWRSAVVDTDPNRINAANTVLALVGPITQVMDAHAARTPRADS